MFLLSSANNFFKVGYPANLRYIIYREHFIFLIKVNLSRYILDLSSEMEFMSISKNIYNRFYFVSSCLAMSIFCCVFRWTAICGMRDATKMSPSLEAAAEKKRNLGKQSRWRISREEAAACVRRQGGAQLTDRSEARLPMGDRKLLHSLMEGVLIFYNEQMAGNDTKNLLEAEENVTEGDYFNFPSFNRSTYI